MESISTQLAQFHPINLDEMDAVKLMDRRDTKFVFKRDLLPLILEKLSDKYKILQIAKTRSQNYHTLYFDNQDFLLYTKHHNGKLNRYKIRYRRYIDSDLCFLEIKYKNNKGRTMKKRVGIQNFEPLKMNPVLSPKSKKFIVENSTISPDELVPKLRNKFTRLTLVEVQAKERITIDYNLKYSVSQTETPGRTIALSKMVIAEVKQEKYTASSDFIQLMRENRIQQMRISKYCIGCCLLYDNLKYNNFKLKLLILNKIHHGHLRVA